MNNKRKYSLIIAQDEAFIENSKDAFEKEGFICVVSQKVDDALLKLSNQDFQFAIIDMDTIGLDSRDFISSLRKKEAKKNIKDKAGVIVCGSVANVFNRYMAHIDNVKFLEMPISEESIQVKIQTFFGKQDVISENTKKVKKGEVLVTEGGDGHAMFWILEGEFEIIKTDVTGEEIIIGDAGNGELVGEMSFLDDLPRSASIRAKMDSEVLVIPQTKFADVLNSQPRWFRSLMKTLSQRLRDANEKIADHES